MDGLRFTHAINLVCVESTAGCSCLPACLPAASRSSSLAFSRLLFYDTRTIHPQGVVPIVSSSS